MKKNILSLLLCALLTSTCLCGCGSSTGNVNSSSQNLTEKPTEAVTTKLSTSSAAESEPEQNSSEMVIYLTKKGRTDAKTATDDDIAGAVEWLKDNINDYFADNEHMEDTIYYGALLESHFSGSNNQYERAGWQAQKTVKYVYQGVDSQFDDNTQKNLQKLQALVEEL